ncbi:MAG: hypothetical protein ACI4O9_08150 [Akkermansia sp.]
MTPEKSIKILRRILKILNQDVRRYPFFVYRVMLALADATEPISTYAVARRAGFLLEHGRVKLHGALAEGVVERVIGCDGSVLWQLSPDGRAEMMRMLEALRVEDGPIQLVLRPFRRPRGRRRKGDG